jgi:hypothetical protein
MARNGIQYLSIGPNFGHRIGHLTERLGDRPFYWEGPSGESRVLTWVSGGGYAWFHSGLGYDSITARLDEEKIFRYMDQLVGTGYPYDLTYLRYNIGSDNGPPDPGLAEAVREWNSRYASPTLRISGTTEVFREFERRYGDELPTYRGDMTGHWEDGAASSARETTLVRRVAEALPQTEALADLRGAPLDPELLAEAWRNVLLFYEHTWGSWNSISEPFAELTTTSWERKRRFADDAWEMAGALRDQALAGVPQDQAPAGTPAPEAEIQVFNTLDWARTDLVLLSPRASSVGDRVVDAGGSVVPSQRLSSGELAFLARDVPARGVKGYRVEGGDWTEGPIHTLVSQNPVLESSAYTVRVDPSTGAIVSWLRKDTGAELVGAGSPGLNQYLYVPGRDPAEAVTSETATVVPMEWGPLVRSLQVTAEAPGLREPLRVEIRLVEGLDRVDVTNRLAKAWTLDPEAVLFRFPFAPEDPEVWIDAPFGPFRPELDQLPGASKNYFSLQRWVDVSGPEGGVTMASIDVPLVQMGAIRTDAIVTGWLESIDASPVLYSYVMNNYWETNYRAAQDDEVEIRFSFRAHGPFQVEEARRFGLERARPLVVRTPG